ncbi:class I SAM-dependent methyltransferase [Jidongwangia harbinensis]|uniref:class I SAM-dependent methyltransferase n=1 Tax=Jidongwangia harbinensis TaxID=2878561 RepID=UPI001CD9B57C|nr:class I SAM-dependent methyltransferase [Jidongwangia harbinensis]MCA2213325.1 class I SAM-dependent methyltransferase [Jidongwangia harbinensis]
MTQIGPPYEDLVGAAVGVPVPGWEFAWLDGRADGTQPSWSYPELARPLLRRATSLLDLDTGGGELLVELSPLPPHTVAVESWTPNVPVARDRLAPYGVSVVTELPGGEEEFDVVLSRHGRLPAEDVARLLRPGGTLLSQQVGSDDLAELNAALGAPAPHPKRWTAEVAVADLEAAGLAVTDVREERPTLAFHDVGAIVYQLRAVPWQVRDFDPQRYERALRRLDAIIRTEGHFTVQAHRFLVQAYRPPATTGPAPAW